MWFKYYLHFSGTGNGAKAGEGTPSGPVTPQEREKNIYRLSVKQSLKEIGLDSELDSSSLE